MLEAKADLGVVFDTDVDRSAVIDADGKELNRNRLIALLAHIVLREHPGSTIVTDSVTSDGVSPRYIPAEPSRSKASTSRPRAGPYFPRDSGDALVGSVPSCCSVRSWSSG